MTVSYAPLGEPLASELIAALIELTAVARKASSAPPEHRESVANDLLTCVLTLCKAERGAILLHEDRPRLGPFEPASATQEGAQAFHLLALHQMRAEEANALLAPTTTPGAPVPASDTVCWLVYRLSLDEGEPDEAQDRLALLAGTSFDLADQAQSALLIIGVKAQLAQGQASSSLLSRCSVLLPLIATAFEAVIATLLLKERVDALEREEVRDALKGMELLKAELLGTVSHELRGPLASIKGYAATLLRHEHRLAREERHQFLLAIHEASDRLAVIVARLLDLSQLETGQAVLERSPVDMARLARRSHCCLEERVTVSLPTVSSSDSSWKTPMARPNGASHSCWLITAACAKCWTSCWTMRSNFRQGVVWSPSRFARLSRYLLERKRWIPLRQASSTILTRRLFRATCWSCALPITAREFPPSNWNASLSAFTVLIHA